MKIDEKRYALHAGERYATNIFVRAQHDDGSWESVDIWVLDRGSLLEWLRSRGGNNVLAENVVGVLLEHGHLHGGEGPVVVTP